MVEVLVNKEKVEFDEQSILDFRGVSVTSYVNTSRFAVIFNSGISVTIEGHRELLGLQLLVPTVYKGSLYTQTKILYTHQLLSGVSKAYQKLFA